jgi:hypothetical protein
MAERSALHRTGAFASTARCSRAALVLAVLSVVGTHPAHDRFVARAAAQAPAARTAPRIDAGRLMSDLATLAGPEMAGRLTGSDGSRRAQAFILDRFAALGLEPVNGVTRQSFSFRTGGEAARTYDGAVNLMGMVKGRSTPGDYVLVTAHYDHLGVRGEQTYFGADDNASGVAALLSVAAWLARHPAAASVVFVAFDGEEEGLRGARQFVAAPPLDLSRVRVVVNLDMIGRGDKNQIFVAGPNHYPALKAAVLDAARDRSIVVTIGHDQAGVPGVEDWTQSSDHGPFHAAGVPFLYFGVEDHADYHKPTDTAERIPRAFYAEAAELVLDVVRRVADSGLR